MYRFKIKSVELAQTFAEFDRKSKRAQEVFGQVSMDDMQNYVPLKTGALRGSGHLENRGKQVVWEVYSPNNGYPYGVLQYYTQFENYTTPGTGPYWDQKATGLHMSSWERKVGEVYR